MSNVVELGKYLPAEVREAAKAAYVAKLRHERAIAAHASAARRLAMLCRDHHIDPSEIEVGHLNGESLIPASFGHLVRRRR